MINGFHDTANAVATVIDTMSLKPTPAVVWSGLWNFIGVHAGGIGVAFSIVHLLPVDLLVNIQTGRGLAMVPALLPAAITWNFATWYRGLPASSSHALIGSIMGVGMTNAWLEHGSAFRGLNWHKVAEVMMALVLSPLVGFGLAAGLLLLCRALIRTPRLYAAPEGDEPPLNDMLAALRDQHVATLRVERLSRSAALAEDASVEYGMAHDAIDALEGDDPVLATLDPLPLVRKVVATLDGRQGFHDLDGDARWSLRTQLMELGTSVRTLLRHFGDRLGEDRRRVLASIAGRLSKPVEYVPEWVKWGAALCLGLGTMVGWKRIVVTVGEKIGKSHLTYAPHRLTPWPTAASSRGPRVPTAHPSRASRGRGAAGRSSG